ncbi:hypothetical protein IMZ31_19925 (plasmid) [Pontibacillus sp. ALD_SL1]|uniref:hypothetical protein n=1 Tax=Pontibacillus sp. ALD_SL1 TaxID=2777185 RepID=UPI001A95C5F1|nr:hypothetical protein [Pontibacillus sp. ALD_SL1]QST02821.1 hypothetical protein IMZ31_19925 [Pontibacillus sp. ALD_SL1]
MKKVWVVAAIVTAAVGFWYWSSHQVAEEKVPQEEMTPITEVAKDGLEPITISVIGEEKGFQSDGEVSVDVASWEDDISTRFILIPFHEPYTKEREKKVQQWISQQKIVLFYGEEVDPYEAGERFDEDITVYTVEGNVSVSYMLYGYGYSETYKKKIPLFLGGETSNIYKTIQNFVYENQHV